MSLRLRLGALALSLICATGSVAADELTLNLRDTNISNLIDLVSEETGTNFIVDPRVRGNITVVSSRPVPRDELMDLFHDILKIHGFAAIPGESSTRIVPDAQAKQDTPTILDIEAEPDADVRGGSIVTHVIALRHVAAAQLVPVLRPLIPQGGHLAAATEPNTLLISDTRSNVHRIRALVERMDLPFADDFEVIELRHARAGELAEQLQVLARAGYEPHEENPMLGFRGASRYRSEVFRPAFAMECEALRRVRDEMGLDNVQVMVPFVRTLTEAEDVIRVLGEEGLRRGEQGLKIVMMCEIPSNALLAARFLEHFDGFSIGSNDLTQLTLGVDRDSGLVADSFDERNDAVKALLSMAIRAARRADKYIGICGQAPSDYPDMAVWLMSEGIDSLSLNPDSLLSTWEQLAKVGGATDD